MLDKLNKSADGGSERPPEKREPVVIKKYANRRLYNTETSTYVTLDDLASMVRGERDFVVYDAKTGDELTHSVLTQIIVEQESQMGADTMLPIPFLQQLIRFYGGNMQKMVPSYLQFSLANFAKDQDKFTKQFGGQFGGALTPAGAFEAFQDQARKNVAMFEQVMSQAMVLFKPFVGPPGSVTGSVPGATKASPRPEPAAVPEPQAPKPAAAERSDELAVMKAQMAAMQAMIEKLSNSRG
jgi:polyhydroxyalkanoate synthesis repressor PhaR